MLRERPGVLVSAHYGNWEMAGQTFSALGIIPTAVAKPFGSEAVTELLNGLRGARGQEIVQVKGAIRGLMKALRQGRNVGLVQDQYTAPSDGGIWVDFMGLPATVSNAAGTLATRLKLPVYVMLCEAHSDGTYLTRCAQCLEPEDRTAEAMTQAVTSALTRAILEKPEQWLWMYRRWKRVKPGDDPERYPFYAYR
jgi:KDO2-lipid IV(A) lauroyltransferase